VLLLQGDRDYQVTAKQYNLWFNAFFEAENWTFKSYPELNHFMMKGEGNSYSSEYRVKNHVDQQVIQDIATFIYTK
ncbi:MAG: alpha/beta hydrolase, partial [Clostridiales bacterium]|nr:alpha/beta hydrolase [Clostridiales bacterium]